MSCPFKQTLNNVHAYINDVHVHSYLSGCQKVCSFLFVIRNQFAIKPKVWIRCSNVICVEYVEQSIPATSDWSRVCFACENTQFVLL